MEGLRQVIDSLSKSSPKIEEELDHLKVRQAQLLKELEEVNSAIKLKESNLA